MGPYLAQPVLEKATSKGENAKLKLKFSRCEMQGNNQISQVGADQWKTQRFQS